MPQEKKDIHTPFKITGQKMLFCFNYYISGQLTQFSQSSGNNANLNFEILISLGNRFQLHQFVTGNIVWNVRLSRIL